ncbi:MAG: thioredoxin family protein [Candidatus Cybelea sp.]
MKKTLLSIAALATVLAIIAIPSARPMPASAEDKQMVNATLPSFNGAVEWLNSKPLTGAELRGKVVLVEFWTYTCVNWLRTLPYVRAWAAKYHDKGLVVIGVHTPEFGFEKNLDNVRQAMKEMHIEYPVAIDSNYAIWNAFGNEYWPAMYFIDAQGRIRHHHFGEGDYDQSERIIQQLLVEAGNHGVGNGLVSVDPKGLEAAADWSDLKSEENFLGFERTQNFASPGGVVANQRHVYEVPAELRLNEWALSGAWTMENEGVALNEAGGKIAYRFHARDVNLIMGARSRGTSVRFRVLVDGQPPGAAHGGDVDADGYGSVSEQRTYQLIRQPKPIADRQFEIQFLGLGVEAFDFTFG